MYVPAPRVYSLRLVRLFLTVNTRVKLASTTNLVLHRDVRRCGCLALSMKHSSRPSLLPPYARLHSRIVRHERLLCPPRRPGAGPPRGEAPRACAVRSPSRAHARVSHLFKNTRSCQLTHVNRVWCAGMRVCHTVFSGSLRFHLCGRAILEYL